MTDIDVARRASSGSAYGGIRMPRQPAPAARVGGPRWRDARLLTGVLLILVAVLIGGRVLSTAGRTTAVLTVSRDLTAGHVLAPGDLRIAQTHLGVSGSGYWPGADLAGLAGHPLTVAVAAGDLLPRSAVAAAIDPAPTREVSVPVDPTRLPGLLAGQRVDVFATYRATGTGAGLTLAVLRGAEYLGQGDGGGGTDVSIRLRVPVADTAALVRASEVASIDVVLQEPVGDSAGDVGAGPVLDPPAASATPAAGASSALAPVAGTP